MASEGCWQEMAQLVAAALAGAVSGPGARIDPDHDSEVYGDGPEDSPRLRSSTGAGGARDALEEFRELMRDVSGGDDEA